MAKIEIDNVKMWESILGVDFKVKVEDIENNPTGVAIKFIGDAIKQALEDQGLKYKDGHIISILEQTTIRIEKGNWYTCSCEIVNDNQTIAFPRDEIYYCPKDGYIDVKGMLFEVGNLYRYFRPATEEEIPQESQRMVSAEAKEALYGKPEQELTEFEKAVGLEIFDEPFDDKCIKVIKEESIKLLSIARKQIASEIDMNAMADEYYNDFIASDVHPEIAKEHRDSFIIGVESVLKALEK